MRPGRSAFVRATSVSGEGAATGTLHFVSDSGVVFGIRDDGCGATPGPGEPGACAVDAAGSVAARSRTQRPGRVSREGQRRSDVVAASPTLSPPPPQSTPRHRGGPSHRKVIGGVSGLGPRHRTAAAVCLRRGATPGLRSPLASASTVPLPTAGSQPAEGRVRRVFDALHDLSRGQFRCSRPQQSDDSADDRCGVTRSRNGSLVTGRDEPVDQSFAVGVQRHDPFARRGDVDPRSREAERRWRTVGGPPSPRSAHSRHTSQESPQC